MPRPNQKRLPCHVLLDADLIAEMEAEAERSGLTFSDVVRLRLAGTRVAVKRAG